MKCSSCGAENPSQAKFCLRCGAELGSGPETSHEPLPVSQYVTAQAQTTLSKMIETPGTALLTIGMLILVVSILVGALGHWLAALALFAISIILLFFAVQLRGHESRPAAHSTEIREREIVKVKCRYCGALNPDGARNCSACGAML